MAEYADKYLGQIPDMTQGHYSEQFSSPMRTDSYVETISGRDMTINFPCINLEGLPSVDKQKYELYDDTQKSELYDDKQMPELYDDKQKSELYDDKQKSALYDDKQMPELYDDKQMPELYDGKQESALYDDKQKSALYDDKHMSELYDGKQESALYDDKQMPELYDDKQKSALYDDKQNSALYDDEQMPELYDDDKQKSALYDDKQKSALYDDKQLSALYDDKQKSELYDGKQKSALYDNKQMPELYYDKQMSALYDDKQKSALYDDKQMPELYDDNKSALYDDKQMPEMYYGMQKSGLNNVMNLVSGAQNKTDRVEVETGTWETSYDAITCSKGKFLFHPKDEIETFPLNKLKDKEDMMNKVMKRRLGSSSNENSPVKNSPVKNSPVKKRKTDTDEQGLADKVKKNILDERISETHFRSEGIGFDTGFEDIIAGDSEGTKGKQRLYDNWSTVSDSKPDSTVEETSTVSVPKVKNDLHVDNCKRQSQQGSNVERSDSCLSKSLEVFKGERSDSCLSHMVPKRSDAESQPSGSSSKNVSTKQSLEIKVTIPPTVYRFKKDKDNTDSSNDNFVKLKSPSGHHKKGKDIPEETVKMSRPSVKLNIPFDKTETSSAKKVHNSDSRLYEPKLLNVPVVDSQKEDFREKSEKIDDVDETDGDPCSSLKLPTKDVSSIEDQVKKHTGADAVVGVKKSRKQNLPKRLVKHTTIEQSESETGKRDGDEESKDLLVSKFPREQEHKNTVLKSVCEIKREKIETYDTSIKTHEKSRKQSTPKRILDDDNVVTENKKTSSFNSTPESHHGGRTAKFNDLYNSSELEDIRKHGEISCHNSGNVRSKSEKSRKQHLPKNVVHVESPKDLEGTVTCGDKGQYLDKQDIKVELEESAESCGFDKGMNIPALKPPQFDSLESLYLKNLGHHSQNPYLTPEMKALSQQINLQAELLAKLSQNQLQKVPTPVESKDSTVNDSLSFVRKLREIQFNKYRKISIFEKKHIAGFAKVHGVSAAANYFGVSKSAVSLWTRTDFKETDEELARKRRNCMIGNEKFETLVQRVKQQKGTKFKNLSKEDKEDVVKYAKLVGVREMSRCLDIALGTVSGWMRQFPYAIKKRTDGNISGEEAPVLDVSDVAGENKDTDVGILTEEKGIAANNLQKNHSDGNGSGSDVASESDDTSNTAPKPDCQQTENCKIKSEVEKDFDNDSSHLSSIHHVSVSVINRPDTEPSNTDPGSVSQGLDCSLSNCMKTNETNSNSFGKSVIKSEPSCDGYADASNSCASQNEYGATPEKTDQFVIPKDNRTEIPNTSETPDRAKDSFEKKEQTFVNPDKDMSHKPPSIGCPELKKDTIQSGNSECDGRSQKVSQASDIETDLENMIAESYVKPDVEKCFEDIQDQIIGTVLDEDEYFEQLFKRVTETRTDKYKSLKASEKLEVVRYAKRIGVRRIAKLMDLATGTLSGWINKYQHLLGLILDTNTESDPNTSSLSASDLGLTVGRPRESGVDVSELKENLDDTNESGGEGALGQTPGRSSSILDNVEKTEVTALRFLLKDRFPLILEKIDIARKVKFKNLIPAEKVEIVKCAKLVGIRPTARVFQMPLGTLSGWISKYSQFLEPEFQGNGHGSPYRNELPKHRLDHSLASECSNSGFDNSFTSLGNLQTDLNTGTSTPGKVAPHLQWRTKLEQNEAPVSPYSSMMNEMAEKSFSSYSNATDLLTPDGFNSKANLLNRRVKVEWPKVNQEECSSTEAEVSWPKLKMPNGVEEAISVPSETGFPNFLLHGNSTELTNDETTKELAQKYLQEFGMINFSN